MADCRSAKSVSFVSDNNTDHPSLAVVNNLLKGILEFHLAVFRQLGYFGLNSVLHNLLNGFPEDVSILYPFIALPCILLDIGD